jgi:hypothetical protein
MARKSKEFTELLQQQQDAQLEQTGMNKLQQKVKRFAKDGEEIQLVHNPAGMEKMSEVLEAFVEPYLDFTHNRADREKLFLIAVAAWNLALLPSKKRSTAIKELIAASVDKKDRLAQQDIREILKEMIARKLDLFADNQRFIMEFQLQETKGKFHLSVASNPIEPSASEK